MNVKNAHRSGSSVQNRSATVERHLCVNCSWLWETVV
jgi:hypothetical protein